MLIKLKNWFDRLRIFILQHNKHNHNNYHLSLISVAILHTMFFHGSHSKFLYTVEPSLIWTSEIRTPPMFRALTCGPKCRICMLSNPWNQETSIMCMDAWNGLKGVDVFSDDFKQHGVEQQHATAYYAYFSQYNFYTDVFSMKVRSDTVGNTETMMI